MPLSDMSTARGTYFASQLPVMAILTSEAEYATRYAFPAGRFFSTLLEKDREITRKNAVTHQDETIDEGRANTQPVGHFEPYRTNALYPTATVARENVAELSASESARSMAAASVAWRQTRRAARSTLMASLGAHRPLGKTQPLPGGAHRQAAHQRPQRYRRRAHH